MHDIVKTTQYSVPAILRCFKILEGFSPERQEISLAEIVKRTGIHKTTVFRILSTLESLKVVVKKQDTGKYEVGPGLFELAARLFSERGLVQISEPHMVQLRDGFSETVCLAIRKADQLHYAAILESPSPLRMVVTVGDIAPLHASALGKSVVALLSDAELNRTVLKSRLERFTENTICDPVKLRAELNRIRQQGYSLDQEEVEVGARCVGAAIFDYLKEPIAALSISGPAQRIRKREAEMIEAVRTAATAISRKLGFATLHGSGNTQRQP